MATYQKRFRVSDGTDDSNFVHSEIFNSLPERISLKYVNGGLYDDSFTDNSLNANLTTTNFGISIDRSSLWESYNAHTIAETNQEIRIGGSGNNSDTWIGKAVYYNTALDSALNWRFRAKFKDNGVETLYDMHRLILAKNANNWLHMGVEYAGAYYKEWGKKVGGVQSYGGAAYTWTRSTQYTMEMRWQGGAKVAELYFDGVLIDSVSFDVTGNVYLGFGSGSRFNNTLDIRWDDFQIDAYPPTGPSPGQVWEALAVGSTVKWSTARLLIYKNGTVQAASSTDVKLQYAVTGGAFNGSWLTLAGLQALSDTTITDATNSVKLKAQFNSNGTDFVESDVYLVVDVDAPAGGGGSRLLDGGLIL